MKRAYKTAFGKFEKIATAEGWSVEIDGDTVELQQYTDFGQDFIFSVPLCRDYQDYIAAVYDYYKSFDPCAEALLWVGPDGHGRNGAPHDLRDIIADMEAAENMIYNLYQKL